MLFRLLDDKPNIFPDPHFGEEDGLIAIGGDLSPERLITAYNNGIFPWYGYKENEDIMWWCPLDRFVIFPKEIHISHSMRQLIKKGTYETTINQAFEKVIENCSKTDKRNEQVGAWLGDDMISAYKRMYELGLAASIDGIRKVISWVAYMASTSTTTSLARVCSPLCQAHQNLPSSILPSNSSLSMALSIASLKLPIFSLWVADTLHTMSI